MGKSTDDDDDGHFVLIIYFIHIPSIRFLQVQTFVD